MANFTFLIEDSRYAVSTLEFTTARDARHAEEIARRRLNDSAHYRSVAVHLGETLLFQVVHQNPKEDVIDSGHQGQSDQVIGPM